MSGSLANHKGELDSNYILYISFGRSKKEAGSILTKEYQKRDEKKSQKRGSMAYTFFIFRDIYFPGKSEEN